MYGLCRIKSLRASLLPCRSRECVAFASCWSMLRLVSCKWHRDTLFGRTKWKPSMETTLNASHARWLGHGAWRGAVPGDRKVQETSRTTSSNLQIWSNQIKTCKMWSNCEKLYDVATAGPPARPCTFPFERAAAKQPGWMLHSSPATPNERTLRHANEAEAMQQFDSKKHWI